MPDQHRELPPLAERHASGREATPSILAQPAADAADLLARRAARYRQRSAAVSVDSLEFVVFERAGVRYAIDVRQLLEIRPLARLTAVPGAAPVIKGIVQVRGQVVALHDLASLAGDLPPGPSPFALVGTGEAAMIALLADSVEGVAPFDLADIHQPPVTLGLPEDCISGVTADGALILHLGGLIMQSTFFQA